MGTSDKLDVVMLLEVEGGAELGMFSSGAGIACVVMSAPPLDT